MKKFDYTFREGLPGGPNEVKGRVKGSVTKSGYKRNSPDVDNDFNVIPSPYITMVGVDFPVYGEDNLGNGQMMYPGENYEFPGDYVTEMPAYGSGGLTQWFAEEWVDVKTGKKCGRSGKDKKGRPYPACRPSKRVNKTTPKTTKEMSSAEKAKFKKSKTSSKRINYNHKRAQFGGRSGDLFQEVDTYIKPGQNIRPNWAQTSDGVTNYTFGKNLVDDESRFSLGLQGNDIFDEIKYRADAIGSVGVGLGNRKGKGFRPAGENLRAGLRGQASWQGIPGNVIENMLGRRSGLDWRGSIEGEAGVSYANGAVRPYMSIMPQTNVSLNDNLSLGLGYEMRGRYDKNFNQPLYGNTDTGTRAPVSQRDAYSGMGRGAGRFSLNYDLGNGDFIEGYYAKPNTLYQGSMPGIPKVMALESEGPRFGVRLRKSFQEGGSITKAQEGIEVGNRFLPPAIRNMQPKEDPIYYDGMLAETTVTAPKYEGPQIRRAYPGETDPINANQMFVGVDRTGGLGALKSLAKGITKIAGVKKAPVLPKYIENVSVGNSDLLMTHAVPKSVSGIKGTKDGVVIAQAAGPKGNHMTLKKFADPAGSQDYYAFTESFIDNPMLAGRAFKMAEDLIPKGSILKQPSSGSLSQDSFNLMTRRLGNPKRFKDFTNYDADYINLNEFGKGRSRIGQDGFTFSQRDFEALNNQYLNYFDELGVPEFRGLGSRQVPILKQPTGYNPYEVNTIRSIKDPRALDKYYQLSVPNITLQKLYRKGGSLYKAQEGVRVDNTGGQYVVQKGDTFYGIANKLGMSKDEMRLANPGLDYNKIQVGQSLAAPGFAGPPQGVAQAQSVKPATKNDTYNFNDLLYRQAYQESKFDPNAISPLGYKGFTQIGSGIMQDYADATGDKRNDPFDPDYAIAVQKWAMDKYLNNTDWIKGSDKVKQAKALAAYNWGPGNTVKYLNAQKAKGVDIYSDDLSWIKNMPKETRGYISNILSLDAENNARWEAAFQRDTTGSKYSDYYKQKGGETLYDYVKGLGYSPTFKNRKQIFGDYFQEEYKGTAKQNIELLNKLKAGDLNIDQYAQKADVQRVAEPVIQQPVQQPVQQIQTPLPVQETPTQKSSYRGSTSLSTDEDLNRVRQGLVKRANDIISGKADPYRLPSNVANIVKQQKHNGRYKNPDNYTCIGGVCTLLKSEGVIDEVITSNTEFARVANNSGFSKQSFKLENLKEGDVIQHMGQQNKSGNPYPTHAQMYLGRDEDGNYMFFDNWEITSDKAAGDKTKDGLKKYSPEKMETFIKKGQEGRVNGAYFLHLNKEDAYDPEEQTKRARAQKNKARRLPGELYIDENFDGREYDQEVQSSQDIPYIYKGTENANAFEEELVGLFGNSEMDERMKKTFGITEQTLNEIKPYIYGVMAQESNMGVGAKFDDESGLLKNVGRLGRAAKYQAESVVAPTGAGDLSYGPGSVRWSGLRPSVKKQIGKRKNLNNAEGAYFAVADMLLQKANQAERYVGEDINEDLLDQNAWYPALYAYSGQMLGKDKKGNRWGMITGRNRQGQRYSADPGSYPMKVQGYADQLKRFVPIDYEPTIDNYYNPRYVPVVKPKGK